MAGSPWLLDGVSSGFVSLMMACILVDSKCLVSIFAKACLLWRLDVVNPRRSASSLRFAVVKPSSSDNKYSSISAGDMSASLASIPPGRGRAWRPESLAGGSKPTSRPRRSGVGFWSSSVFGSCRSRRASSSKCFANSCVFMVYPRQCACETRLPRVPYKSLASRRLTASGEDRRMRTRAD